MCYWLAAAAEADVHNLMCHFMPPPSRDILVTTRPSSHNMWGLHFSGEYHVTACMQIKTDWTLANWKDSAKILEGS